MGYLPITNKLQIINGEWANGIPITNQCRMGYFCMLHGSMGDQPPICIVWGGMTWVN